MSTLPVAVARAFQYGFTFDETINEGDTVIEKNGVTMVVDGMSLQYLVGGSVDYIERSGRFPFPGH